MEESTREGAALLDFIIPDWHQQIDTKKLDLNHKCNCILGQLFGHFDNGLVTVLNVNAYSTNGLLIASDWGFFALPGEGYEDRYGTLKILWLNEISIRRGEA